MTKVIALWFINLFIYPIKIHKLYMVTILIFFVAHWYLSLFFQTFFHHRYAAHKAFYLSRFWEKMFYFLSWVFQGSSYLSPYGYAVMHRMHHAFPDTENDPHSPQYSSGIFDMMWKTKLIYCDITNETQQVDAKYKKGVPQWEVFDKFARSWPSRLFWGLIYTLFYVKFAPVWWLFLLLPIHYLMGPVHGVVINWFAHKFGYVNYKVSDTSKNLLPFDFLMLGESYHNNHHTHSNRANFGGVRWHEIDPVYIIIKIFSWVGILKLKKQVTQ